jgi:hypothetical protein
MSRSARGYPRGPIPNQLPKPASNRAKPAKRRKSGANGHFFAESDIPFALPSPPQPAYPDAAGMPVSAGTDGSVTFLIPRRRREWLKVR